MITTFTTWSIRNTVQRERSIWSEFLVKTHTTLENYGWFRTMLDLQVANPPDVLTVGEDV